MRYRTRPLAFCLSIAALGACSSGSSLPTTTSEAVAPNTEAICGKLASLSCTGGQGQSASMCVAEVERIERQCPTETAEIAAWKACAATATYVCGARNPCYSPSLKACAHTGSMFSQGGTSSGTGDAGSSADVANSCDTCAFGSSKCSGTRSVARCSLQDGCAVWKVDACLSGFACSEAMGACIPSE